MTDVGRGHGVVPAADAAVLPTVEVLRPTPWKRLALLAVSAGIVWLALDLGHHQPLAAWLCGGFFGLCAVVAAVSLLPGASQLRLDAEGLEIRALFRTTRLAWRDIARFGATRVGLHPVVGVDFAAHVGQGMPLRRLNRGLSGYHGALPDTYGCKAAALAVRLEAWRQAHDPPAH